MIAITDRKEYKANAGIKIISDKEADKIIETREPRGLFVYAENGLIVRCDNRTEILCEVGAKFIGIDNSTGDAWTEEFDTYEDCVKWLLDPNREAHEAHEEAEPMHYNYPRVKFVDSNELHEQLGHIESELGEIEKATNGQELMMELLDLQHSVETAVRIAQEHEVDIEAYRQLVIEKNRKRGYYDTTAGADNAAEAGETEPPIMLTKKQLEDAARCDDIPCSKCSLYDKNDPAKDCMAEVVETALAYMEMLERSEAGADNAAEAMARIAGHDGIADKMARGR